MKASAVSCELNLLTCFIHTSFIKSCKADDSCEVHYHMNVLLPFLVFFNRSLFASITSKKDKVNDHQGEKVSAYEYERFPCRGVSQTFPRDVGDEGDHQLFVNPTEDLSPQQIVVKGV